MTAEAGRATELRKASFTVASLDRSQSTLNNLAILISRHDAIAQSQLGHSPVVVPTWGHASGGQRQCEAIHIQSQNRFAGPHHHP